MQALDHMPRGAIRLTAAEVATLTKLGMTCGRGGNLYLQSDDNDRGTAPTGVGFFASSRQAARERQIGQCQGR